MARRNRPLPERVEPDPDAPPSRSALKRAAEDLQALGAELAAMPADRRAAVDMPEALRDAVDELVRTRTHEGRRRQLQFVGKQMRGVDPEPLREAVAAWKVGGARDTLALHRAEAWRDRLAASDDAVTRWAEEFPGSDVAQLRRLVRAARAEPPAESGARRGKAWRALYLFIRPAIDAAADAAPAPSDAGGASA